MVAHVGRDVQVEFAIADENAIPASLTYAVLGMVRGKALSNKWDDVDTTADKSPDYTKTSLVTFKGVELSLDGVAYDDDIHNQEVLEGMVAAPSALTNYQPKVWFRITYPSGKKYEGPYLLTSWDNDDPYDGTATWSASAKSNGAVVFTPSP